MLFFVVAIALLAAVNADHSTNEKEIDSKDEPYKSLLIRHRRQFTCIGICIGGTGFCNPGCRCVGRVCRRNPSTDEELNDVINTLSESQYVDNPHITTVQDVNTLIDGTIKQIQAHKRIPIPELNGAEIAGLEHLRRNENCVKTSQTGEFQCKAIATEATFNAEGEKVKVTLHISFDVVVDSEKILVNFKLQNVDMVPNEETKLFSKISYALKKGAKQVVKIAANALHLVVEQKVKTVARSIVG